MPLVDGAVAAVGKVDYCIFVEHRRKSSFGLSLERKAEKEVRIGKTGHLLPDYSEVIFYIYLRRTFFRL